MKIFISENKIYKETITGFREGYSTGTALIKLKDNIKVAMKSNEVALAVLIDFSKAFDTISHLTLIKKLQSYGFSKEFLKWTCT